MFNSQSTSAKNSPNPFGPGTQRRSKPFIRPSSDKIWIRAGQEAVGLALIDAINEEENDGNLPSNRCSKLLKAQIPSIRNPPPADFGIKTRSGSCQLLSPAEKGVTRQLSWKEMESSEEYTCVISHGPNPTTTHIFDDCIVESCPHLHSSKFCDT